MREVKINRIAFNPNGENKSLSTERVPFDTGGIAKGFEPVEFNNTTRDSQIEDTLNFVQENSSRNMRDDEKDMLRNIIKNPNSTKEQISYSILTLQGKHPKQANNLITTPDYYMKKEANGVYVPIALGNGEVVPKGEKAASIWGTQEDANKDTWYVDLGKSVANAIPGVIGNVYDVADAGYSLVTGEDSKTIKAAKQNVEALKFNKDEDLNKQIYSAEGVEKFSDLVSKDRFDLSADALWGTLNSALTSVTEFGLTGGGVGAGLKALSGAATLGKVGARAAAFTGSYITQLGEGLDAADEAGLTGRDRGAFASLVTVPVAAVDAAYGLDGKILSAAFKKSKEQLLKELGKTVERDALGNITEKGFKELAKKTTIEYGKLAKNGVKEIVKDVTQEGGQEAAQAFLSNAGEQLWDKMSSDEKSKFGTDAFDAKSFAEYIQNGVAGLVSGSPTAVMTSNFRKKHDEQSINAYERVKEGPEAVNALKTDLNNALDKGEITPSEHEQALFKIDKYNQYHELTSKYNIDPKDEKRAFELSFQIEGMKTEIPKNENEISKLDPIPRRDRKSVV